MHQTIDINRLPDHTVPGGLRPETTHDPRREPHIGKLNAQAILQAFLDQRDTGHAPDH